MNMVKEPISRSQISQNFSLFNKWGRESGKFENLLFYSRQ